MNEPAVAVYVIGQTPRPDLTNDLKSRFPHTRFEVHGALDDTSHLEVAVSGLDRTDGQIADGSVDTAESIHEATPYPLETRLRDGHRVVVDGTQLEPLIQVMIDRCDERVAAHLVLCAGPFPGLASRSELLRPFDVGVTRLASDDLRSLELAVPFTAQAPAAVRKWEAAGFSCRVHLLDERPEGESVATWLSGRTGDADALVFDYVGFPSTILAAVAGEIAMPVFDLGHLAFDALELILNRPGAAHHE